jgi:dTDP-4-dehydrorhamnose reductase
MRVLITGATGLLGRYLVDSVPHDAEIVATARHASSLPRAGITLALNLDLRDRTGLVHVLAETRPDVVIHAAAEGNVDAVQGRLEEFRALNVGAAAVIAEWCRDHGSFLAFISSNAVFGGSTIPYQDRSPLDPVNDYGRLKAEAEGVVQSYSPDAFVARPILMYGWPLHGSRRNPVVTWVNSLRAGNTLRIVDDVITQPLAASDAAAAIWRGISRRISGPVNMSGGVSLTLLEFARATAETFHLDPSLIEPISSSELAGLAPRPMQTEFDLARLRDELEIQPVSPMAGLRAMQEQEH